MTDDRPGRNIAFHLKDDAHPIWAIRDVEVPTVGDLVAVEDADGSLRSFTVVRRLWITAKQGESSFGRVRLIVEELTDPKPFEWYVGR